MKKIGGQLKKTTPQNFMLKHFQGGGIAEGRNPNRYFVIRPWRSRSEA